MEHKAGIRKTPLTALNVHPDNPRQGDVGAIIQSIETNGWYGTLVAQVSTGNVLAGNHRLQAAIHCGLDRVPVHWVDVDDETATRILIADNRTSDLARNDDDVLAELLREIAVADDGLSGTGYDGEDLDRLLADIERNNADLDLSDIGDVLNDGLTPAEREASWRESGIRSFILPYSADDFPRIVEAFAERRQELEIETNSELVAHLLGLR